MCRTARQSEPQAFASADPLLCTLPIQEWDIDSNRALRVGYISPDLYTHSVSYFAEAPLSHHNSEHVQHYVYCCVPRADAKTARLKAAVLACGGVWHEVQHLTEPELARLVRADRIDILVDLTGEAAGLALQLLRMLMKLAATSIRMAQRDSKS